MTKLPRLFALATLPALLGCVSSTGEAGSEGRDASPTALDSVSAHEERVPDFGRWIEATPRRAGEAITLERVSAGVPWPRGLEWVDGELVVLARGRHRRAGGVDHSIADSAGVLFRVDPAVAEPVVSGALASERVARNASVFALPDPELFHLPDPDLDPVDDFLMDRPYCTLIWDEGSRNLFICGYSGVDLPGRVFRKNATDSIHRYDLRTAAWYPVEMHRADVVPVDELGWVVSDEYYPHHDPATNPAPHGWLNGPDGGAVAGDYLYVAAKDNHLVVRYDLKGVRSDPAALPPASEPVLGPRVRVRHPQGEAELGVFGPSAAAAHGGYLYIGYRTSSVVLRFALDEDGRLGEDPVGELIAVFEPWSPDTGRSANLIDLAFNQRGELFAACGQEARVWKIGVPDPAHPFYGNDQSPRPTSAPPYVDLSAMTGKRTNAGNILFDDQDRLYICAGNYDTNSDRIGGVIYRAVEVPAGAAGAPSSSTAP